MTMIGEPGAPVGGAERRDRMLARAASTAIDLGVPAVVYTAVALMSALIGVIHRGLADVVGHLGVLVAVGSFLANVGYLQSRTGQSIGRRRTGLVLAHESGSPAPPTHVWARAVIDLVGLATAGVLFVGDRLFALATPAGRRLTDLALQLTVRSAS